MNSLRRLLAVFDLFRPDQPVIDVDIICRELGYTPATAYRYLRELGDAGLLKRLPRGYALGPRIVTLEQLMTHYDPLLACSQDLVEQLVADTGLDALVSEWHGDSVVNVLVQRGTDAGPVGAAGGSRSAFSTARRPGWYWPTCCHARSDGSMTLTLRSLTARNKGWNGRPLPRACLPFASKATASATVNCTRDAVVSPRRFSTTSGGSSAA